MKHTVFTGVAAALITPIDENGINYEQLATLIDWQIEQALMRWSSAELPEKVQLSGKKNTARSSSMRLKESTTGFQ